MVRVQGFGFRIMRIGVLGFRLDLNMTQNIDLLGGAVPKV